MKKLLLIITSFAIGFFYNCSKNDNVPITVKTDSENVVTIVADNPTFYRGMDLSFQMELESYNIDSKDANNNSIVLWDYVKLKGCNWVRLKLWHSAINNPNSLALVKSYALKLKQRNIPFLLDIHYSDTWADPANQTMPAAWQNLNFLELKNQVYLYTKNVLDDLKNQNTMPSFVQIGNETDNGFLWNFGKIWGQFSNNWVNYSDLVKSGIRAVREVNGNRTKIILHYSNPEIAEYFFQELAVFSLDFDVIGLSYYPQYHTKDLTVLQTKLNNLAARFNKQIMIVEVAYPFSLGYQDNLNNIVGSTNQILPNYDATIFGQKDFLSKIKTIVQLIPNQKGIGFVYWAPDWVAFAGNQTTSMQGSSWENQCLWDFNHQAVAAIDVFAQ